MRHGEKARLTFSLENISENVYPSIDVNLEYVNVKYNTLINSDIKIREFKLTILEKEYNAFLLFIDGMIDSESINNFIYYPNIKPKVEKG